MGVTVRRGRRRKQLLDGLKEMKVTEKIKAEAPYRNLWRSLFGRVCGLVTKQTTEWNKERTKKNEWISFYQSRQTTEPSQCGLTLRSSSLGATNLWVLDCFFIHSHLTSQLNLHFYQMVYVGTTTKALPRS